MSAKLAVVGAVTAGLFAVGGVAFAVAFQPVPVREVQMIQPAAVEVTQTVAPTMQAPAPVESTQAPVVVAPKKVVVVPKAVADPVPADVQPNPAPPLSPMKPPGAGKTLDPGMPPWPSN